MNEELHPYSEMKPTGLMWLPVAPRHWEVKRAKQSFREVDERSEEGDEELLSVSHKTGVTPRSHKNVTMFMAESYKGHKLCRSGDIVVNTMWAWMAAIGVSRQIGIVSPSYGVYRPRRTSQFEPRYLDYLLRTEFYKAEYLRRSRGVTTSRLRLYPSDFLNIPFLLPTPGEQQLIVRFLNWHGANTAKVFRTKKKLISLLNEQKQAIINDAVARGLDHSVRLKQSGFKWLGNVPAHWNVTRFKQRVGFQEGPGIMAADFREDGVPLLRISCLAGDVATLEGCNFLDPSKVAKRWAHFAVEPGDYLLTSSASTGKVVLATETVAGSIPYTGIIRLWPISNDTFMPFMRLFVGSRAFQDQIDTAKSGVAIEHFGPTHLKRMCVALPPLEEQKKIVESVQLRCSRIDAAIDATHREMALILEYRARLIADVVAGKLDVRSAASGLPETVEEREIVEMVELGDEALDGDIEIEDVVA